MAEDIRIHLFNNDKGEADMEELDSAAVALEAALQRMQNVQWGATIGREE